MLSTDPHFKPLYNDLTKNSSFTLEELEYIASKFKKRTFKKNQYIFNEGDVHRYNVYIAQGALRLYCVDDQFKEYSLNFAFESWWSGDLQSYVHGTESELNLQALENSIVLQINYRDQRELWGRVPSYAQFNLRKFESALMNMNNRIMYQLMSSAEERYDKFVEQYDKYTNRLPDKHIASFIGVTPEFYSKIKKKKLRKFLGLPA